VYRRLAQPFRRSIVQQPCVVSIWLRIFVYKKWHDLLKGKQINHGASSRRVGKVTGVHGQGKLMADRVSPRSPHPRPVSKHESGITKTRHRYRRQVRRRSLGNEAPPRCEAWSLLLIFFLPSTDQPRSESESETKDPTPQQSEHYLPFIPSEHRISIAPRDQPATSADDQTGQSGDVPE
jgi:hypothetical protein